MKYYPLFIDTDNNAETYNSLTALLTVGKKATSNKQNHHKTTHEHFTTHASGLSIPFGF